jgi:hypothetical protein
VHGSFGGGAAADRVDGEGGMVGVGAQM